MSEVIVSVDCRECEWRKDWSLTTGSVVTNSAMGQVVAAALYDHVCGGGTDE